MVDMTRGQDLHRRACRGEQLSEMERRELDTWYAEMDAEEAQLFAQAPKELPTNAELQTEIENRLAELEATFARIRSLEKSNEALRKHNEELRRELVAKGILVA